MDHPAKLVIVAFLASLGVCAHAGYAQLANPEGFSGGQGNWKFAPAANDQTFGKVVHQPNGLKVPVPGKVVTMPASYRFAANAGRFAAGVVFMHPYVRTAAGVAAWLGLAGIVWDAVNNRWVKGTSEYPVSEGFEFEGSKGVWYDTADQACGSFMDYFSAAFPPPYAMHGGNVVKNGENFTCVMYRTKDGVKDLDYDRLLFTRGSACPVGWYVTPAGCLQTPPPKFLDKQQFEDELTPLPMPETVPKELPYPTPLPVDPPWINPAPGPNPEHRPRFVPTGDPVKNPN